MGITAKCAEEIVETLLARAIHKNGCLISHLRPNKKGYIPVSVGGRKGKKWRAHRLVYHILCEELLEEDLVLHSCNERGCINPKHLIVGTAQENTQHMLYSGRQRNQTTVRRLGYVSTKSL